MDADDLDAQDEAAFFANLQRILQGIDERHALPAAEPCRMCKGSGICWMCRGNGRLVVQSRGLSNCTVCVGDGACVVCRGTGERRHG